jgi:hypothetical protein
MHAVCLRSKVWRQYIGNCASILPPSHCGSTRYDSDCIAQAFRLKLNPSLIVLVGLSNKNSQASLECQHRISRQMLRCGNVVGMPAVPCAHIHIHSYIVPPIAVCLMCANAIDKSQARGSKSSLNILYILRGHPCIITTVRPLQCKI